MIEIRCQVLGRDGRLVDAAAEACKWAELERWAERQCRLHRIAEVRAARAAKAAAVAAAEPSVPVVAHRPARARERRSRPAARTLACSGPCDGGAEDPDGAVTASSLATRLSDELLAGASLNEVSRRHGLSILITDALIAARRRREGI